MIVKRLTVYDPALIQADFPGTQFIAGRKSVVEPDTAVEHFGMMLLVKVDEELADVLPQFHSNRGEAFQPFDFLPVLENKLINPDQGRALMVCLLKYLL